MNLIDNRYRVLKKVGKGGMGEIYKIKDTYQQKTIALKIINKKSSKKCCESLKKEFELLARLRHPNLCRVYDFGIYENHPYFTMEYIKGKNILSAIRKRKYDSLIPAVIQILRALSYLHSKGIIHGDLKPQNIIYNKNKIRLIDFGLADFLETEEINVGGTLPYLAPEVILERKQDIRSDLYSLGVILYEIISGHLPFKTKKLKDIIRERTSQPKPLKAIPPEFSAIIKNLLTFEPSKRFNSAQEVIMAISKKFSAETKVTKESYLYTTKIIGREDEIEKIKRIFKRVGENKGNNLVFVTGEQGIGKSRLLEEIKLWAEVNNFKILVGHCYNDKISYEPYRRIISEIGKKEIFKSPLPPKFNLWLKIGDIILAVVKKCRSLLIILEDIDIADEVTVELTSFLSRRLEDAPILIIVSSTKIPQLFTNAVKIGKGYEEINLKPLSKSSTGQLIEQLVNIKEPSLFEFIYSNCRGNPLFVREILHSLINKDIVNIEKKVVKQELLNNITLPLSLATFAKKILEQLDNESLILLKICALMEERFTVPLLASVLGSQEKTIEEKLNMLSERGLLRYKENHYEFSHIIHKEQVKKMVGFKEKSLHQKIARYFEKRKDKNRYEIAMHYIQAGIKKKGIFHGFKAAEEAINAHNPLKALAVYQNLEKVCNDDKKGKLFRDFGGLLHLTGKYEEALKKFKKAEVFTKKKVEKGMLKIKQARALQIMGRLKKSESVIKEAEQFFRPFSRNWVVARNALIYNCFQTGEYKKALQFLHKIKENIKRVNPEINGNIGLALYQLGKTKEAEKYYLLATRFAKEPSAKLDGFNNLGILYYQRGLFNKALDYFKKCLNLAKKQGDLKRMLSYHNNIGIVYRAIGQRKIGLEHLKNAFKISYETFNPEVSIAALTNIGELYYDLGELDLAQENLSRAIKMSKKIGISQYIPNCLSQLGRVFYGYGRYRNALECYLQAINAAKNHGAEIELLEPIYFLAETFLEIGFIEKAEKEARRLSRLAGQMNVPVGKLNSLLLLSEIWRQRGNLDKSIRFAEDSITIAREIGKEELLKSLNNFAEVCLSNQDLNQTIDLLQETENEIKDCSNREVLSNYYLLKAKFEFIKNEWVSNKRCLEYLTHTEKHSYNRPDLLWQIFFLRGQVFERLKKMNDAAVSFQKSIEFLDDISSKLDRETRNLYLSFERLKAINYIEEFLKK